MFCCSDDETSDEEYDQAAPLVAEESDVCTDLDEEEPADEDNESTNQNSEQDSDRDSEDDTLLISQNKQRKPKKKSTGLRILDSDDEDSLLTSSLSCVGPAGGGLKVINNSVPNSEQHPLVIGDHSVSMFKTSTSDPIMLASRHDDERNESIKTSTSNLIMPGSCYDDERDAKLCVFRRSSMHINSEEASMPPLVLDTTSDSEESINDRGNPLHETANNRGIPLQEATNDRGTPTNETANDRGIPLHETNRLKETINDSTFSVKSSSRHEACSDHVSIEHYCEGAESASAKLTIDSGIGVMATERSKFDSASNDASQLTLGKFFHVLFSSAHSPEC